METLKKIQDLPTQLKSLGWEQFTKMMNALERGLFVPDGKSVLLKFEDLFELEKDIQVAYLD